MSDFHEYEIAIIIRDKERNIYGDNQQEQAVRTIVRDEMFDWDDNIEKLKKIQKQEVIEVGTVENLRTRYGY